MSARDVPEPEAPTSPATPRGFRFAASAGLSDERSFRERVEEDLARGSWRWRVALGALHVLERAQDAKEKLAATPVGQAVRIVRDWRKVLGR